MQQTARFADLRLRLLSAVVLGGAALLLLRLGGGWTAGLVALLAAAMAWEWRAVTAAGGRAPGLPGLAMALAAAAAVLVAEAAGADAGKGALAAGAGAVLLLDGFAGRRAAGLWSLLGLAVVGLAALALLWLRGFGPEGFLSTLWIVIVVAATDTGGYFAGRLIGGPKLWPSVSPKKTWAGLGGAVTLAFFAGGLFSWATTGTYFHQVCTVSAIAALLAQAGDLAESALKRRFGVKDASGLIPGHGGALDRFDGLIAATLVAAAVTWWRGKAVFVW